MKYMIITANNLRDLMGDVNEHLIKGYTLQGGLATSGTINIKYHQAVCKILVSREKEVESVKSRSKN